MKRFDPTGGFTKGLATSVPLAWLGTNCGLDANVLTFMAGGLNFYRATLFPPKPELRAIKHRKMFNLGLASGMAFGMLVTYADHTGFTAKAQTILNDAKSTACELVGCEESARPQGMRNLTPIGKPTQSG